MIGASRHGGRTVLTRVATTTLVLFLLGGSYAVGAIPSSAGELTLCFDAKRATKTGLSNVKLADLDANPTACSSRGLASLKINQQGPAGPPGPAGGSQGTTPAASVQQQNAPGLISITREPGAITVATLTSAASGRHIAFGQIVASGTVTAYQSARCWML
jgi:hypothetical protein